MYADACFPSGDMRCAIAFTIDGEMGGYTLAAITARFQAANDPHGVLGALVVTLHEDTDGIPGALLATLHGDNPLAPGDYTWTCSGAESCTLEPNAIYFVQVMATVRDSLNEVYVWASTLSDHETQTPAGNG